MQDDPPRRDRGSSAALTPGCLTPAPVGRGHWGSARGGLGPLRGSPGSVSPGRLLRRVRAGRRGGTMGAGGGARIPGPRSRLTRAPPAAERRRRESWRAGLLGLKTRHRERRGRWSHPASSLSSAPVVPLVHTLAASPQPRGSAACSQESALLFLRSREALGLAPWALLAAGYGLPRQRAQPPAPSSASLLQKPAAEPWG